MMKYMRIGENLLCDYHADENGNRYIECNSCGKPIYVGDYAHYFVMNLSDGGSCGGFYCDECSEKEINSYCSEGNAKVYAVIYSGFTGSCIDYGIEEIFSSRYEAERYVAERTLFEKNMYVIEEFDLDAGCVDCAKNERILYMFEISISKKTTRGFEYVFANFNSYILESNLNKIIQKINNSQKTYVIVDCNDSDKALKLYEKGLICEGIEAL